MRKAAYEAWVVYGPGTTRNVSECCGIDLLTFRPRTTELVQLGLLVVDPALQLEDGTEGVYRAAREEEWERWKGDMVSGQLNLI